MLHNLAIRNIILIESLDIPFTRGLCVLTGETGAGKSILLDALGFVLGERMVQKLLRHGANQGSVTAEFTTTNNTALIDLLEEQGIEHGEETLCLRRIIYPDGRNKCFANDVPVSVNLLKQIGGLLLEIHGQHDQRGLLEPSTHMAIIDAYGHLEEDVTKITALYHTWKDNAKKLAEICEAQQAAQREEDYLRHIAKELESLAPEEGEEDILAASRTELMNKEKLLQTLDSALNSLTGANDVRASLFSTQKLLMRCNNLTENGRFDAAIDALERASVEVQEATESIERTAQEFDNGNERLETVEERLFALRAAARKFNLPVDALAGYNDEINAKLTLLDDQTTAIQTLEKQVEHSKSCYQHHAKLLSEARKETAHRLEKALAVELSPLKMGNTRFEVSIQPAANTEWSAFGMDKISFLASTNPGSPLSPLAKIASGGELSRFMLAIKVVLAGVNSTPTLIFDEVDSGIGGAVADAVGRRLQLLGNHVQILVVTHQPQVAAKGTTHFKVIKESNDITTSTSVTLLSSETRKEELARMLAGEHITPEARAAADKLLEA